MKPALTPNEFDLSELLGEPTPNLPSIPEEMEDSEAEYEARKLARPKGRIAPRKQASKSSLTQQRLALEAGIRDYMEHPTRTKLLRDALDRSLRIAAYGLEDKDAIAAFRVIFEKFVSSPKQDEEAAGAAPPQVTIVIENATVKPAPQAIDAEFTDTTRK